MNDKLYKYVQWILYLLMGLSALFIIMFYISPGNPDLILYWMWALLILSGVVILSVSGFAMLKNPKGSYKVLIVVAGMILIGIVSYFLSSNTYSPAMLEKYKISANGVKWVGAGLLMSYFIMIIAIVSLIYASVSKYFK